MIRHIRNLFLALAMASHAHAQWTPALRWHYNTESPTRVWVAWFGNSAAGPWGPWEPGVWHAVDIAPYLPPGSAARAVKINWLAICTNATSVPANAYFYVRRGGSTYSPVAIDQWMAAPGLGQRSGCGVEVAVGPLDASGNPTARRIEWRYDVTQGSAYIWGMMLVLPGWAEE